MESCLSVCWVQVRWKGSEFCIFCIDNVERMESLVTLRNKCAAGSVVYLKLQENVTMYILFVLSYL